MFDTLRRTWARLGFLALLLGAISGAAMAAPIDDEQLDRGEIIRLNDEAAHLLAQPGFSGLLDPDKKSMRSDAVGPGDETLAPSGYDVLHYGLEVTPDRNSRAVTGRVTITLLVTSPTLTTMQFNARVTVDAVSVEGTSRTWTTGAGLLNVPICQGPNCPPHAVGDTLEVVVDYHTTTLSTAGYYHYPRNGYTFAEPFDAQYWWVCRDDPADKATLDLYATVPDTNSCYSNGLLQSVVPSATAGKSVWHWRETHPIATYLVSIAVFRSWELHQVGGGVPILSAVFPEDSTKAKADFLNVPAMMDVFEARWTQYPFDKYGQAVVTNFGGGMEHQTMTTLGRSLLLGNRAYEFVFAHELAHHWWGDWVTCQSFADIWLNEGFASYGEAQWAEDFYGEAAYSSTIASQMSSALSADSNFRYPVYNPPANYTFGTTIYKKGSLLLHMLRRILGDGTFFAGLQLYGNAHAYGNATSADFQAAMETASGQPLAWFFNPWLYNQGQPTYQWSWVAAPLDAASSRLVLSVRQTQTNAPYFRMPIELVVTRASLPDTTVIVWNEAQYDQEFSIPMAGTATSVAFDPRNSIFKRMEQVVGVPDDVAVGPRLSLAIAPNPARGPVALTVTRSAGVAPGERTRVRIFDASGRRVRNLDMGPLPPAFGGAILVAWDLTTDSGARVTPGVYFASASAGTLRETRPIVVVD